MFVGSTPQSCMSLGVCLSVRAWSRCISPLGLPQCMDKPAHAKKRAQRRRLKNCRLWELMLSDILRSDRCCATGRVRQTSASQCKCLRLPVAHTRTCARAHAMILMRAYAFQILCVLDVSAFAATFSQVQMPCASDVSIFGANVRPWPCPWCCWVHHWQ